MRLALAIEAFLEAYTHLERYRAGAKLFRQGETSCLYYPEPFEAAPGHLVGEDCFVHHLNNDQAAGFAEALSLHPPHLLSVFHVQGDLKEVYARFGYLPLDGEFLMGRSLQGEFRQEASRADLKIERVDTYRVEQLNRARGHSWLLPSQLEDPLSEIYCLDFKDEPISWGRLSMMPGQRVYISGIYTVPGYRGGGFARSLWQYLLNRAFSLGATTSVAVTTSGGYALGARLGYRYLSSLQMFMKLEHTLEVSRQGA